MDITVKSIVHSSLLLVAVEYYLTLSSHSQYEHYEYWIYGGKSFLVAYVLCILSEVFSFKDLTFVKSTRFKNVLSVLHGSDGLAAFLIGVGIKLRSKLLLWIGLLIMTKFFLIHLLNRMILANKKADNLIDGVTQTSKSFLHHIASFLFLYESSPMPTISEDPYFFMGDAILLTTLWRTISMSGHAILVLRGRLESKKLSQLSWALAYLRNAFMLYLLLRCLVDPHLRESMGISAVGHIAYMAVRVGPVFKLGSMYLSAEEKEEWVSMSDWKKLKALFYEGKHPWLAFEIILLVSLIILFLSIRLSYLTGPEKSPIWLHFSPQRFRETFD